MALASTIMGLVQGGKMLKEAKKINPLYKTYDDVLNESSNVNNPIDRMMGMAQMQLNARNPMAEMQRRMVMGSTANTQAAISRGAVDPTMAIQGILASQNMADQSINNMAMQDQQMFQNRLNFLAGTANAKTEDNRFKFNNYLQKYVMDMDRKTALQNAGRQTQLSAVQGFEDAALRAAAMMINPASGLGKALGGISKVSSVGGNLSSNITTNDFPGYQPRGLRGTN